MSKQTGQTPTAAPGAAPPKGPQGGKPKGPGIFSLLKPYKKLIFLMVLLSFIGNSINLILPKIIARGIDAFTHKELDMRLIVWEFLGATFTVFLFTYAMIFVQT